MNSDMKEPTIDWLADTMPPAFNNVPTKGRTKKQARADAHKDLLEFLLSTLRSDTALVKRRERYANSDRVISTWKKLSPEDSKRVAKQQATGMPAATAITLPTVQSHLDDMVAFFAEVYSPNGNLNYTVAPNPETAKPLKDIADRLNQDSSRSQGYVQLTRTMRSLLKYNIGGFWLEWKTDEAVNPPVGYNARVSLDMYNLMWDPTVTDPMRLRTDGEWAALAYTLNRRQLVELERSGEYYGIRAVVGRGGEYNDSREGTKASFYRYPPIEANVSATDDTTSPDGSEVSVDWKLYGRGLSGDSIELRAGYEVVKILRYLNPIDYGLIKASRSDVDAYALWEFHILNGERVVKAQPYVTPDVAEAGVAEKLPVYLAYLNDDDLRGSSRSVAELLIPFQNFGSFMFNAHIAGARNAIWGLQVIDESMFDTSGLEASDGVTGRLKSKQPGRDVRTGIMELKGNFSTTDTMRNVAELQELTRQFFPSQALPSQIANMDRAVQSQVSAVLQGVNRRLHMLVKFADDAIFNPLRFDEYLNLIQRGGLSVGPLDDSLVRKALGSGLAQLQREVAESAVRNIMMSVMSNPKLVEEYNMSKIFDFWTSLLPVPVESDAMKLERNPQPTPQQQQQATGDAGAITQQLPA